MSEKRKLSLAVISEYIPLITIVLIAGYFFISKLGRNIFWDWDECLYAQYAKEMPLVKHYISNIWNSYVDLQKPPLYSWILIFISKIFGLGEFQLRLVSVLSALGLLTAVYMFCKKYYSVMTAVLASIVLLTGELFVIYSTRLNTDIIYTLFIFLAYWAWLLSYKKHTYAYVSALLFGISTMLKGIGSMQFVGALFLTIFIKPSKEDFIRFAKLFIIYILMIIPWHVLAYLQFGEKFIKVYFFENIIKRGTYPLEFHRERWWFYFVLLFRELKPWIFAALLFPIIFTFSVISSWRKKKIATTLWNMLKKEYVIISILVMILVPLVSLVRYQTRIAWYALPLYPFIAIYIAYNLEKIIFFVANVFQNKHIQKKVYFLIGACFVIAITADSVKLLIQEIKPFQQQRELSNRNAVILETKKYPQKELYYLVAFTERQARELLPPTEQIDMTWVYGGNPCAVFYSDKKVRYFYYTDEFLSELGKKDILYLSHRDDKGLFEGTDLLLNYENDEYMLFSYK